MIRYIGVCGHYIRVLSIGHARKKRWWCNECNSYAIKLREEGRKTAKPFPKFKKET